MRFLWVYSQLFGNTYVPKILKAYMYQLILFVSIWQKSTLITISLQQHYGELWAGGVLLMEPENDAQPWKSVTT